MFADRVCFNPLTGRTVWAVRGKALKYPEPWEGSCLIIRPYYFAPNIEIQLAQDLGDIKFMLAIRKILRQMPNVQGAWAERDGEIVWYRVH